MKLAICDTHIRFQAGCSDCRRRARRYRKIRTARCAAGQWDHTQSSDIARQRIAELRGAGMTNAAIARAAGIDESTVWKINHSTHVRAATTRRLLAVHPEQVFRLDQTGATGTTRRIQALAAIGYTFQELSARLGTHPFPVRRWAYGGVAAVTKRVAARVCSLYDELSMLPPPSGPGRTRMRNIAQREGWVPPLAWDDATIDDPNAAPCSSSPHDLWEPQRDIDEVAVERALAGRPVRPLGLAERARAVEIGATRIGLSDIQIGRTLGIPTRTVLRIRQRHNIAPAVPCSRPTVEAAA